MQANEFADIFCKAMSTLWRPYSTEVEQTWVLD